MVNFVRIILTVMTKSRLALNPYTLAELKNQIALKLGFPITGKSDCKKLSEILMEEGYGSISETTLYRLFVNYNGITPYKHTLNVLSSYIGLEVWEDFIDTLESNNFSNKIILNNRNQNSDSLLFHCIFHETYKPLQDYFESIQNKEYNFKVNVALEVFDSLLKIKKPELFFAEFTRNKFVKEFVLEDGFDPSFRITNYDYAYKLYTNEIKNNDSLESLQDFVFSQSVLFRHYFISKKLPEALEIGEKIFVSESINSNDLESIYIFPNIRFKAYKIWFLEMTGKSQFIVEDYANEILDYFKTIYCTMDAIERKIVFHTLAEVFCYSSLSIDFHWQLKLIFKEEFSKIPKNIFEKHLYNSLSYLEANGLLLNRPNKLASL